MNVLNVCIIFHCLFSESVLKKMRKRIKTKKEIRKNKLKSSAGSRDVARPEDQQARGGRGGGPGI